MTIKNVIGYLLSTQSLVLGKKCFKSVVNLIINEHPLIEKHHVYCLEKVNSWELYNIQLILQVEKPTSQTYFEKHFQNPELEWEDIKISILPRHLTINKNFYILQYKLLHNILYLNQKLYKFVKKVSPYCSFYMEEPEIPIHLFHACINTTFL